MDAVSRLIIAVVCARRIQGVADKLISIVAKRITKTLTILFTSDDWDQYLPAIRKAFGFLWRPRRRVKRVRKKEMKYFLPENILYEIVNKIKDSAGRVIETVRQVVRGSVATVEHLLAQSPVSYVLNTSFVERMNGTFRTYCSRLIRRTYKFSKKACFHDCHIVVVTTYYNFIQPHRTLSADAQRTTTPAMAAGVTGYCWTWEQLCNFPISM